MYPSEEKSLTFNRPTINVASMRYRKESTASLAQNGASFTLLSGY
jgi:hypothetical protein